MKFVILYIFLTLFSSQALSTSCQWILREKVKIERGVTFASNPVLHHLGNIETSPRMSKDSAQILDDRPKVGGVFHLDSEPYALEVKRYSQRGPYLEAIMPLGSRRYFTLIPIKRQIHLPNYQKKGPFTLQEVEPSKEVLLSFAPVKLERLPYPKKEEFDLEEEDLPFFATLIAHSQSESSKTAHTAEDGQVIENIQLANFFLLEALHQKKELSKELLLEVNAQMNFNVVNEELIEAASGVLRGTSIISQGSTSSVQVTVNLETTSVSAGGEFAYIPPEQVSSMLDQLIQDINKMGPNSLFDDAIRIYRRFIIIHPFVDGNGRTGRSLLDYVLIKIGYPPVPHDLFLTRDTIYFTEEELIINFLKAYSR